MTDPTQDIALPQPPPILGGRELYDAIMGQIEPELTTAGLATLDQLYADETPEQKKQRAARYNAAFAEYEKRFKQYNTDWLGQFTAFQRQALASVESIDRADDEKANEDLFQRIQQAA